MQAEELKNILLKYNQGICSPEEAAFIENWYLHEAKRGTDEITNEEVNKAKKDIWQRLLLVSRDKKPAVSPLNHYWVAAASLAIIFWGGMVWWSSDNKEKKEFVSTIQKVEITQDIPAGSDQAVLKFGNGQELVLDSTTGSLIREGDLNIKNADGTLHYESSTLPLRYHTLITPRGGQYKLQLADGTTAWLNAASTIYFPTGFNGADRTVTISGEVYFEVAKDLKRPFIVNVGDKYRVEVLGTHFNVNAYNDNDVIATTLLEGKVKVKNGNDSSTIYPGQQSIVKGEMLQVKQNVNLSSVMAWKNGFFHLEGTGTRDIMKQLCRWYDIHVVYVSEVPDIFISGDIPRGMPLSQVLKVLRKNDVETEIDGRTLKVFP